MGEAIDRLALLVLREVPWDPALNGILADMASLRDELRDQTSQLRVFVDHEWDAALTRAEREDLLLFAERLELNAKQLEYAVRPENGPIGARAPSQVAAFNLELLEFTRTARQVVETLRAVVADEERDDEDALAAFDAVDPSDPVVPFA